MNKIIYSYGLDSVCNSSKELTYSLDRIMYETIALNGDKIVLTFNQLADSKFIMSFLNDNTMKEVLINLFKQHKIIVSRYKTGKNEIVSTAVQYIKGQIEEYKKSTNKDFIFSSVDFLNNVDRQTKQEVLKIFEHALLYCDLNYLSSELSNLQTSNFQIDDNDVELLINYADFLIRISLNEIEYLPPKNTKMSFIQCIDIAINALKSYRNEALSNEISKIYSYVLKFIPQKKQSRSEWIKCITFINSSFETQRIIEAVINVCYNLAVESSISNIESIESATDKEGYFLEKLEDTLSLYKRNGHKFYSEFKERTYANLLYEFSALQKQYWVSIVRIIDKTQIYKNNEMAWKEIISRVKWKRTGLSILIFTVTIIALFAINALISFISDFLNNAIKSIIRTVAVVFVLGGLLNAVTILLSDLLSYQLNIPNLAEMLFDKEVKTDLKNCKNITKNKFYNIEVI